MPRRDGLDRPLSRDQRSHARIRGRWVRFVLLFCIASLSIESRSGHQALGASLWPWDPYFRTR